jgi:hypothetical protein
MGFQSTQQLLKKYQLADKGGHISQEFQDFGYRLAVSLEDIAHKSLYMRLAKTEPRSRLEQALAFVTDSQAKSKAKLFMWKLKQLKQAAKAESATVEVKVE